MACAPKVGVPLENNVKEVWFQARDQCLLHR